MSFLIQLCSKENENNLIFVEHFQAISYNLHDYYFQISLEI